MNLEIDRILKVGTVNITQEDDEILRRDEHGIISAYPLDDGHLIWVPVDDPGLMVSLIREDLKEAGFSRAMADIFAVAMSHRCHYVRLDRDMEPIEGLTDCSSTWERDE